MIYISDHIFLILPFIQDRASICWVLKSSHLCGENKKKIAKWFSRTSWQIIGAGGIRTQDRPRWLNIITGPWEFWMCRRINANSPWVFSPFFFLFFVETSLFSWYFAVFYNELSCHLKKVEWRNFYNLVV